MTTHAASFSVALNRDAATPGLHPRRTWTQHYPAVVVSQDESAVLALPTRANGLPPAGYNGCIVRSVTGIAYDTGADTPACIGSQAELSGPDGSAGWWAVDGAYADNGGGAAISRGPGTLGRMAPGVQMAFGGDAKTAIDAVVIGTFDAIDLMVTFGYEVGTSYLSDAQFCEFYENPPDDGKGTETRVVELLQQISERSGASYLLGTNNNGEVVVNNCGFAALAPEGAVWIRPEDFNSGNPDGIPLEGTENLASQFRFHPSVFFRRTDYVREVRTGHADEIAFNNTDNALQAFKVTVVDSAPTDSQWMFIIDGASVFAVVEHPAGSDFRRPRDIWNNVIVPLIEGTPGASGAVLLGSEASAPDRENDALDRLNFVQYARCLGLTGTNKQQYPDIP